MSIEPGMSAEESLDPQDWSELRTLGHRMLDDMLDYLEHARERPVWRPIPPEVRERFGAGLPEMPQPLDEVYRQFQDDILPYQLGNTHPRFWGWVIGTGTPEGMLAEMLAAGVNPNVWGGSQIACDVEQQVLTWLKQAMGFPSEASGLLVSGGSMANIIGLTVARNLRAGTDVRATGVPDNLRIYVSSEGHSSLQKGVELLGVGSIGLIRVPVNPDYQIDVTALRETIETDLAGGLRPICVIGCAGTVNTGAIDDLEALADLCKEFDLWLHVDGAFGSLAALAPGLRPLVKGLERADSLAFDLHKWLYMPYDAGCILVKSGEDQRQSFTLTPDYLALTERGVAAPTFVPNDYGPELSRGFRALKAWVSFRTHGFAKYGRMIQQNVDQARYLCDLVEQEPDLELLAPAPLNIVCFRYRVPGMSDEDLDRLNAEILIQLQEQGIAVPSHTLIGGRYALRVAITNHRSRRSDFDLLVQEVIRIGGSLLETS